MTRSVNTHEKYTIETPNGESLPSLNYNPTEEASSPATLLYVPRREDRPITTGKWNEALCCEARNSLQVVLSGAEILLEEHFGTLHAAQKDLILRMTENAHHLSRLLGALVGPEEIKLTTATPTNPSKPRRPA